MKLSKTNRVKCPHCKGTTQVESHWFRKMVNDEPKLFPTMADCDKCIGGFINEPIEVDKLEK